MPTQVKVEDLEIFRVFRVTLLKFKQAAEQSLSGADAEISRTHSWLENEQTGFWQGQLRKRSEALVQVRDAVRQKKLYKDFSGHTRDASAEEKVLLRCVAAVEEAQQKLLAIRKALPRLEKEADLYRGGVARLGAATASDIPKAVALLDRLAATLEQYVQIETPAGLAEAAAAIAAATEESMSRGGEEAPGATPGAPPAASTAPAAPQKEGGDVPAGQ